MTDLTEFLLARIAEDEAVAKAAIDPERPGTHWQWSRRDDSVVAEPTPDDMPVYLGTVEEYPTEFVGDLPAFALNFVEADDSRAFPHIARHDPARVLAECEAKRRIVEIHDEAAVTGIRNQDFPTVLAADYLYSVLQYLALPYATHPDYREEWETTNG